MADELTIRTSLSYVNAGVSAALDSGTSAKVTVATNRYVRGTFLIETTGNNLDLGGVVSIGYYIIHNTDSTNYITIAPSNVAPAMVRLKAGEWACFRFDPGLTPYMVANGSDVLVETILVSD